MAEAKRTWFARHSVFLAILLWSLFLASMLAGIEWFLTPANGRHVARTLSSSPAPLRYLRMREWKRDTDYTFAPPAERSKFPGGEVRTRYRMRTDGEAFIEPALRHKLADVSIVFMGGSTTECLYVSEAARFPYLTSIFLEDKLKRKVNGINAGKSGNNVLHSLLLLIGKVVPLKPDFVVLMHATNDIGVLSQSGSYWQTRRTYDLLQDEKISVGEGAEIVARSTLPNTFAMLLDARKSANRLIKRVIGDAQAKPRGRSPAEKDDWREQGRSFESALRSFVRVATAWHVKPVLLTQVRVRPQSKNEAESDFLARERRQGAEIDPDAFASSHDYFNEIIRKVAESENALLIDLARARRWQFGDVYDAIHFTDSGSRKVAEIIANGLMKHLAQKDKE